MRKPLLIATSLLLAGTSFFSLAQEEECGSVTLADMNWNSASLIANIDRFILEHGYGCDAELVPGDNVPTSTSMAEKGEPDIASELWTNSMKEALEKGIAENRLRIAGKPLVEGGEEGFWVPRYLVEQYPELTTIEGVMDNAELFTHPEDPDRYAFYGCPAGWTCQITTGNLFRAMHLDEAGFELIDPGSSAGLSGSIARAYERRQPWFGYYWAPTAILGKYDMVKVDFGSGVDEEHYINCTTKENCPDPKVTMYPAAPVHTITTEAFAKRAPQAYAYLGRRTFTNQQMSQLLAWMEENQADGEMAMEHFLKEDEALWTQWVSEPVAAKVKQALADL